MALPIVAVVGRPNVGKSTLFNKLIGKRLSIVEDTTGVTRDRIYAKCEWRSRAFMVVDTGGIEPNTSDEILAQRRRQAELAIERADVIILVTDVHCGVTADDSAVANLLLKSGKPNVLAVNKCDKLGDPPMEIYEFYNLGLGDPYPISSVHGHGTGDLLDCVYELLPPEDPEDLDEDAIHVAIIGKPNVGKSSLVNRIAGEDRAIVSNVAGTTRDATDTVIENEHGKFVFIDTAGIRKKARVTERIEHYSVLRAYMAVERADFCLFVIDAQEGVTEQDAKIAGIAHERGKGIIIAVNKWDDIEKNDKTIYEFTNKIKDTLAFMSYAEIIFVSAKTGQRLNKIYELVDHIVDAQTMRIPTGVLNEILTEAVAMKQPPSDKGKRLKIYYMTQVSVKPPTFVMFVNDVALTHFSYTRYIENRIRESFGFRGTSIRFINRERKEKE